MYFLQKDDILEGSTLGYEWIILYNSEKDLPVPKKIRKIFLPEWHLLIDHQRLCVPWLELFH
jgi:hypothetical protein